ncbi:cation:proton antiporter domain-containing protein [Ponticoccus alexandrii]|uniref:Potassium transporter n=1 Tax=Ponticoccus alexandrii TaxID=1943633 RepID=A0ABX7F7L8_9RHOB|nr:cation:proton antiporter [Ponticoccus alexandrii]QRF66257.1 potassium transporter [Ponticoccus alexandrii]
MTDVLLLAFIFLVAGVLAVPVASRLGLGSVLGYLIAGIVIGPILSLLHVDVVAIQHFAEFGVVMMLFLVGLELEPRALWQMKARLLGLGGGQILLTTAAVAGAAMLLGLPWSVALAIGLVLALSSTAIVLQTLNEKGLMRSDGGQASFSVLLTQDIAVIPMLALMPLLAAPGLMESLNAEFATQVVAHVEGAAQGGEGHGSGLSLVDGLNGWQTALVTLGAVALVVAGGSFLTGPLFRFISAAHLRELFVAGALMLVIGIALLMSLVGVSPALGTFIAGVVLANSPYRHELESDIDPFRGLLLGLFFMTVGAGINFVLLWDTLFSIVGLTLGLILLKALVLLLLAVVFRIRGGNRWLFGLGLAQAGEFGFVLLTFTVGGQIIPEALAERLLLVVALSMLLTPGLFILYDRVIAPRFDREGEEDRETDAMPEDSTIIVAGAGRVGGIIGRILSVAGLNPTVIDFDSRRIEILERFGTRHHYGDATRPDLLYAAGLERAKMLVIAIDNREQITTLAAWMHKEHPGVHVIARALDRDHVYELWAVGCRDIIRETYDSTLRMGRSAFEALGLDTAEAQEIVERFDARDKALMRRTADAFRMGVPLHENAEYVRLVRETRPKWEAELRAEIRQMRAARLDRDGGGGAG